jgi:hypothetical protein
MTLAPAVAGTATVLPTSIFSETVPGGSSSLATAAAEINQRKANTRSIQTLYRSL